MCRVWSDVFLTFGAGGGAACKGSCVMCKGSCAMCSLISVCRLAGDFTCELASWHASWLLCAHAAMYAKPAEPVS